MNFSLNNLSLLRMKLINVCLIAVLSVALLKIFIIVFSSPMFGYANNYDFVRQSGCSGIWQNIPGVPNTSQYLHTMNSLLYSGEVKPWVCHYSSDYVFQKFVTTFHSIGEKIDYRELSGLKVALLVVGTFILMYNMKSQVLRLYWACVLFCFLSDPGILFYANTLYGEFSVAASLFLVLLATSVIIEGCNKCSAVFICWGLAITWLSFSKHQYCYLAIFFILITIPYYTIKKSTIFTFALLFFLPFIGANFMRVSPLAANTDTFYGAVLPEASNKEKALDVLGLPQTTIGDIGKSWYTAGVQKNHFCPEVVNVSRIKLFFFLYNSHPLFLTLYAS